MYNMGRAAYRNLPLPKNKSKPQKTFGLLSREQTGKPKETPMTPIDIVADMVMQIRNERKKFKNGKA